ncbi:MAG: dimethyl sulfoxide reductase anchor subunit family protein [Rhizobiaceae bacterium]
MHPALSVIAFTVISGVGYGLALVLALGHGNPGHLSTKIAWFIALALIGAGLLCSTLHLGNPQRAWRALSQWRTSWLSREGCMAVLTFVPLTILAAMSIFAGSFNLLLGYVAAAMCAVTVYCTAMIYASLPTIPQWHTGWTPATYLAFALTSGTVTYLAFFAREAGSASNTIWTILSVVFLIVAWIIKLIWARRALAIGYGVSNMETATGLGHIGKVRLLERPHATDNYLTREMAFRIARKHVQIFRTVAVVMGCVVPIALLLLSLWSPMAFLQWLAALCLMVGLFVERWLFFATAKHAVGLYYGGEEALVPAE